MWGMKGGGEIEGVGDRERGSLRGPLTSYSSLPIPHPQTTTHL